MNLPGPMFLSASLPYEPYCKRRQIHHNYKDVKRVFGLTAVIFAKFLDPLL